MSVSPNSICRRTGSNKPLNDHDHDSHDEGDPIHDGEPTVVTEKKGKENVGLSQQEFDRRFSQPTPSPFKRVALVAFIVVMFYLAFQMRRSVQQATQKQNIIYAKRCVFLLCSLSRCYD
jgi:hypothetical protein